MSPYLIICANLYTMSSHSSYVNNLPTITCIYMYIHVYAHIIYAWKSYAHTHIGWAPKKSRFTFFFQIITSKIVQIDSPFRCFDFMNTSRAHFFHILHFQFLLHFHFLSLSRFVETNTAHTFCKFTHKTNNSMQINQKEKFIVFFSSCKCLP